MRTGVRRREIRAADLPAVTGVLLRGFAGRPRSYWESGLGRLGGRPALDGYPRFGFLLDDGTGPVGVALTLFSRDGEGRIRCNLSSWAVEPSFRAEAPLLVASVLKRPDVTFTNISPAPHTWPTIEAQGFRCYSEGQGIVPLLLGPEGERARVSTDPASWRDLPEARLLDDHRGYGCSCLTIEAGGVAHPFVLLPVRARDGRHAVPLMRLVFCRAAGDVPRFAGALGRWMLGRGRVGLLVDGGVPDGFPGLSRRKPTRRYVRGPNPPRSGDLSYTELAIFGP